MMLVRTDASAAMGVGHAMRCLALVEGWIEAGGSAAVATVEMPEGIRRRFEGVGASVHPVRSHVDAADLARRLGADAAVVDGYHLGLEDHVALVDAGARVMVIDDEGESASGAASIVLSQNPRARRETYAALGAKTELLLGAPYILLRREFRVRSGSVKRTSDAARILVSFGGADPMQLTARAVDALADIEGIEIVALVGAANPSAERLRRVRSPHVRIEVDSQCVAEEMRRADVALVAAGSTAWELAHTGVPFVAVATAPNQDAVARAVEELGLGTVLPAAADATATRDAVTALLRDPITTAQSRCRGPSVVDGLGVSRVVQALRSLPRTRDISS